MATSIRIQLGLEVYQIESSYGGGGGGGGLPLDQARALLRRARDGRNSRRLRAFVKALCRSTLEWDDDPHVLDDLLRTGRLRVRPVEALKVRSEPAEAPPPKFESVENEIAETHTVEIELVDDEGNPVPGEPYQIELPDGSIRMGTLDNQGKARITGIEQAGSCKVCFHERDAAAWGPA